jgi:hypothetical protein
LNPNTMKSVTFSSTVRVRRTLHRNNFSEDEIEAYWFSGKEFKRMRREVQSIEVTFSPAIKVKPVLHSMRQLLRRRNQGPPPRTCDELERFGGDRVAVTRV